jgi:glycosyltransferase involved in cell wall biosynthesis
MKLIIQIPCYNEEQALPVTLAALPRKLPGFDQIEWLIVDDGSDDNTVAVAKKCGVDHIVCLKRNAGLATAFMAGIEACLRLGADVIVNTDADNQYNANDIPALTQPILDGRAEFVIGTRPIANIDHFTFTKKVLQRLGSWVVRFASATLVEDAPSGFRAVSRAAAQRLVVFSGYTYTLETVILAGQKNITIASVPVRVNADLRSSRLVRNIPSYVVRSILTIVRIVIIYRPFTFFGSVGAAIFGVGFLMGLRFLIFYLAGQGDGHVQSLILASVLLSIGFQTILMAFMADLLAANRKLIEDVRYRLQTLEESTSALPRGGHG